MIPQQELTLYSSNTRTLYSSDALQSLSLPQGSTQHFRYQRKYVADRLWSQLGTGDSPTLTAAKITVVFVDQAVTESVVTVRALVPLRRGTLLRAHRDGEIAHFYFRLSDFARTADVAHTTGRIQRIGAEDRPPEKYASNTNTADASEWAVDPASFERLVPVLAGSGFSADETVFAGFYGIRRLASKDSVEAVRAIAPTARRQLPEVVYELEEGRSYATDVSFRLASALASEIGPVDVMLEMDGDWFTPLGPTRSPVAGVYDRQMFGLTVRPSRHEGYGLLRLAFVQADPAAPKRLQAPSWSAVIHIKRRWWRPATPLARLLAEAMSYIGTTTLGVLVAVNKEAVWTDERAWLVAAATAAGTGLIIRVWLAERT